MHKHPVEIEEAERMNEDLTRRGLLIGSAGLVGAAMVGAIAPQARAAVPELANPALLPAGVNYDFYDIVPGITGLTFTGVHNWEAVWTPDWTYWKPSPGVCKEGQKHYQAYDTGTPAAGTVTWYWKSNLYVNNGTSGVKVIQKQLNVSRTNLSGAGLTVDGVWGSKTTAAVKRFQTWVNDYKLRPTGTRIAVDGIVGEGTWGWLKL